MGAPECLSSRPFLWVRLRVSWVRSAGTEQNVPFEALPMALTTKEIENAKPAGRGARDVAKRAHETTGQIFRYAIAHGVVTRNPAADFKPSDVLTPSSSENFARVDTKELPTLLRRMDSYDGDALTHLAMRLLAYTFVRTSELIESEWPEFDLDNARWQIPAIRMKMTNAAHRALVATGRRGSASTEASDRKRPSGVPRRHL